MCVLWVWVHTCTSSMVGVCHGFGFEPVVVLIFDGVCEGLGLSLGV